MAVTLKEINGDELVQAIQGGNRIFVDVYSPNCGPCKILRRILEDLSNRVEETPMYCINFEENEETMQTYGITGFPMVLLFENGIECQRMQGLRQPAVLEALIRGE